MNKRFSKRKENIDRAEEILNRLIEHDTQAAFERGRRAALDALCGHRVVTAPAKGGNSIALMNVASVFQYASPGCWTKIVDPEKLVSAFAMKFKSKEDLAEFEAAIAPILERK